MVCAAPEGLVFALHFPSDIAPDAVPKKRGPKTDVLEALLKRVDGLEKRLHSEGKSESGPDSESAIIDDPPEDVKPSTGTPTQQNRPLIEIAPNPGNPAAQLMSPIEPRCLYTLLKSGCGN